MKLFQSDRYSPVSVEANAHLPTPLGTLATSHKLHPGTEALQLSKEGYRHSAGTATIFQWVSSQCTLEDLFLTFTPQEPRCAEQPTCQAVITRIEALTSHINPCLSILWTPGFRWTEGYPESGEGLAARSWVDDFWKVTVGTEDCEFLAGRAGRASWMPPRLRSSFEVNPDEIIGVTEESIAICVPELQEGEKLQFQFVVASCRCSSDELTTWLAVDQKPEVLLRHADCE